MCFFPSAASSSARSFRGSCSGSSSPPGSKARTSLSPGTKEDAISSRLYGQVTRSLDFRQSCAGRSSELAGRRETGQRAKGGGPRRGAVWGGGGPPPGRRSGPVVSSPAGARVGHGGLCGPAGAGRGQPLVASVADRDPGAEAALCGGWSWGLPTSGDHDAEAPLVPVRDGARGRGPERRERVPGQRGGQEAGPAEDDWSWNPGEGPDREPNCAAWGVCQEQRRDRGPEPWVVRGWLRGATSNPPRVNLTFQMRVSDRCC